MIEGDNLRRYVWRSVLNSRIEPSRHDDVAQEVFFTLWDKREKIANARVPDTFMKGVIGRTILKFSARDGRRYTGATVRRSCCAYLKPMEYLDRPVGEDSTLKDVVFSGYVPDFSDHVVDKQYVSELMRVLTARQSQVIRMLVWERYTPTEAGRVLGLKRQSVINAYQRGLQKMREHARG